MLCSRGFRKGKDRGRPSSLWSRRLELAQVRQVIVLREPINVAIEERNELAYVTWLAGSASLGGFLFGYDSAVINGAVSGIQRAFHSTNAGTGFEVASILLGCALGALVAGRLADYIGRRPTMILTAVIFGVTAAWSGLSGNPGTFIFARFLSGIAVGSASVVSPAYIAEISPARIRGQLASLQQLGIVLGIFMALLCDDLIARAAGGVSIPYWLGLGAWRWMFLVEVIPAAVFTFCSILVPESPRYLVAVRREAEALEVLRRIEPRSDEKNIEQIRRTVETDRRPRLSDLRNPKGGLLPIVWVGIGLSVLQQLVGINSIFYYGSVLWRSVGFTSASSLLINVATGLVNIISTLVAMGLIDRVGRKPLLVWGSMGMAANLAIIAAVFSIAPHAAQGQVTLSHAEGLVALLAANLYVFSFGVSWGPCVWVMLGEMFSNQTRGAALAIAVFAQWIANWAVTVSFPVVLGASGPGAAYGIYLAFALVSIFFVMVKVRETKGRTLEEV
ncbi:MAG TPA: sugar porter family MFS transporter [Terriglobia bacterium]|nr:sugar porter family MFS transporter [Terriglobia bacterium]